jgi:hypothetical protein
MNRCRTGDINDPTTWQLVEEDGLPCTVNGQGKHKCNYELGEFCANPYNGTYDIEKDDVNNNG